MMMMGVVGASGVKEIISDYTETCILMPFSSISIVQTAKYGFEIKLYKVDGNDVTTNKKFLKMKTYIQYYD